MPYSIHNQSWPEFDAELAKEDEITLIVQVNGKVRDKLTVPADISEGQARELALASEGAQRFMEGKPAREVIVVPGEVGEHRRVSVGVIWGEVLSSVRRGIARVSQ